MPDGAMMPARTRAKDLKPEEFKDRYEALIASLAGEAERRVQRRYKTEQRWIEDLRQYHGRYSEETLQRIKEMRGSEVFLNFTRPKTNALMARLWDLLFPTDDRAWGIRPTPVPDLTDEAEEALALADDAEATSRAKQEELQQAAEAGDEAMMQQAAGEAAEADEMATKAREYAETLTKQLREAHDRARLMQEEIDDQLKTCGWQAAARDAIADACKIGTGVVKGPVIGERRKQRFEPTEMGFELADTDDDMPAVYWVDPWSFYPDPDVRRCADGKGVYERHLMSPSKLRELAKRPHIDADAVRRLLKTGSTHSALPAFLPELYQLNGERTHTPENLFHVWEYRGPLEPEQFELLAEAMGDEINKRIVETEIDPLIEIQATVWFCEGECLSLALHPLDSGECIYSVFTLEPDEAGPYGFGLPSLMRDEQAIANAAQRMMMDNAGLATGPQIVIDRDSVQPEDGHWEITPRKVWRWRKGADKSAAPFATYDIPMRQGELAAIIEMARMQVDEVTGIPALAQGEQGTGVTKTAQGMALLMNSANIVFRRMVKNFDDDMSVPLIRRFYHWNMQFNEKSAIKGDYDVDARGSSVLLVREMQAQNLMLFAQSFGADPSFAGWIKQDEILRAIARAHMIDATEILRTDREHKEWQQEQQDMPSPEAQAQQALAEAKQAELELAREKLSLEEAMNAREWDSKMAIAQMEHDARMEQIAQSLNMKTADVQAALEKTRSERMDRTNAARITAEQKDRAQAVEVAALRETGRSAGGSV